MSEELEKLLADGEKKDQTALGGKTPEQIKEEELKAKETQLANLNKAIEEANKTLRDARQAKKTVKVEDEDEDIPKINFEDPNAKAWGKHISSEVGPLKDEIAKEKEEVRNFAIKEFLQDKPELAKDPEKVKRIILMSERIGTATGRTREGVLLDLRKAYAAEFADEILQNNDNERIDRARGEAIFSDIAVSRGASSFRDEKEAKPHVSNEDAAILARWGMSPEEWVKLEQKRKQKK